MRSMLSLALFLAAAAGQSTTATVPSTTSVGVVTSTDLPSLISQLPKCALSCLASSAKSIGCKPDDFSCLCANQGSFGGQIGPCILLSSCSASDLSKAAQIAPQICGALSSANPAASSSAASLVNSALATVTTASPTGNAAAPARTEMAVAAMGVAGIAGVAGLFVALA